MTKQAFIEAALAGKREADEFVALALGWTKHPVEEYDDEDGEKSETPPWLRPNQYDWRDEVFPYATCPDTDWQTWGLFGEMWDKLPRTHNEHRFLHDFGSGRLTVVMNETYTGPADYGYGKAPTRCLAVAVALLEALGKFEKEEKP